MMIESTVGRRFAGAVLLGALLLGTAGAAIAEEDSQPSGSAWEFLRAKKLKRED